MTYDFVIYPAIDLRQGRVVRLQQGDPERQTLYSRDPAGIARSWIAKGARWLHVVNLDGAFGHGTNKNLQALEDIVAACAGETQVQFGGGLRDMDQIAMVLDAGVTRAVVATAAIEDRNFARQAILRFGARIAIALDAEDGILMTRGWQSSSGQSALVYAEQLVTLGAKTIIFTDISRDGMETGVNWITSAELSARTGLSVIASGGVSSLDHVRAVKAAGLDGLIVGRALYENRFSLVEALSC